MNESSSLLAAGTADKAADPVNFSASYGMEGAVSVEANADGKTEKASLDIEVETKFVVADHKMHVTMDYDISVDGTDAVKDTIKRLYNVEGELAAKGSVEVFYAYQDDASQFFARVNDGEFSVYTSIDDITGLADMAVAQLDSAVEMLDCSAYTNAFSFFEYNAEKKGYCLKSDLNAGEVFSGAGGMVLKIKDGHLAAIVAEQNTNIEQNSFKMSVYSGVGMVYKIGGQSVTLPNV